MGRPPKRPQDIPALSEAQKAWMAGFLDGEGHFGVSRTVRRKNGHRYYVPIIQVAQAGQLGMQMLTDLQVELGGIGSIAKRNSPSFRRMAKERNWRRSNTLMLYGPVVPALCRMLLPYLRLKLRQAELLVNWPQRRVLGLGMGHGTKGDIEGEQIQIQLMERIRSLNHEP